MNTNTILTIFFGILVLISCQQAPTNDQKEPESFNWKESSFEKEGYSKKALDSLCSNIESGRYGYIDEILIVKNDKIIFKNKYSNDYPIISKGKKGKMGCGIDACPDSSAINIYNYYHPTYHPYYLQRELHTLQSITKSVTSTIVGYAIQEGKIKNVNENLFQYLEDYKLKNDSFIQHYKKATIFDLLTMQLGLNWKEFGMSLEMDTNVSEMEQSKDWIDYTLNQKIDSPPREIWNYNSGASMLLSLVIQKTTKLPIDGYAKQTLFSKMEIDHFYWKKTPTELPDTEGGLYLNAEDLAKFGLLYLQNGKWNNEQLLPENWVTEATKKHVLDIYGDGGKEGYGYQWWLTADETPLVVGLGYGNQILVILPDQKIVGVVYAWNVFDNEAKYIFRDFVDLLLSIDQ